MDYQEEEKFSLLTFQNVIFLITYAILISSASNYFHTKEFIIAMLIAFVYETKFLIQNLKLIPFARLQIAEADIDSEKGYHEIVLRNLKIRVFRDSIIVVMILITVIMAGINQV